MESLEKLEQRIEEIRAELEKCEQALEKEQERLGELAYQSLGKTDQFTGAELLEQDALVNAQIVKCDRLRRMLEELEQ